MKGGKRRHREDGDDALRPPARRQRTDSCAWSFDTRPARADDEDGAREQRSYRFGTPAPSRSGAQRDGAPSRPPASFNWARYNHNWSTFQPRSAGQEHYQSLLENASTDIIVGLGRAGTGKTLLAVQEGLARLRAGSVRKLILGRPAVTADEDLGFLPGSEKDKLTPLLAPMLDAVDKVMGPGAWVALQNAHLLEMQSFAYMRGRTHERAFVLADEVQNASFSQLKLLATRLGAGSKLCILGDGSQPDRHIGANWAAGPRGTTSSIELFAAFVEGDGIARAGVPPELARRVAVARLTNDDCQRSETAAAMLRAFDQFEAENVPPQAAAGRGGPASAATLLRRAVEQAQLE